MKRILVYIMLVLITSPLINVGAVEANEKIVRSEGKYPARIRIGYQPGINHSLLIVAKEHRWLEQEFGKEGIILEYRRFIAGPPMVEAFAGGRLDFGQVGDQPAIQARANGIDVKVIAIYSSGYKGHGLVVPVGSSIKTPADLKDKKVGVTVGSIAHRLLFLYLKNSGLTPKDIKIVNLTPPDIKTSLATKHIDAAVLWDPYVSAIELEKIGVFIADSSGLKLNANPLIVSSEFARNYPEVVRRLLKVYLKSENWIRQNPEKALAIVAKDTGFKPEVLSRALPRVSFDLRLNKDVLETFADTANFLKEEKVIRKSVSITELVDASFLKSIGVR
jgi:sulfonate transport system substrate-binding protein